MTKPTYAYGVVILPPPDLYRALLELRERHPLLRTHAPPHITVKSPFLFRQTMALAVDRLEDLCCQWEPFEIRLGGLGVFRNSILYVRVGESTELTALHQDLMENLDGYVETLNDRYDGHAYHPHLTLADRLAPDDLLEARRLLVAHRLHRRFVVDRIHLLRGKGSWDIARTFALGAS